ncbi:MULTISPECIES: hypothetical protein [Vibrio]|uniref:Uncharacterized protein n=2 Tax=Vibrio TaxID=662 RepID=A0A1E5D6N1_9VIBR|nr:MULTISPECIES: hypothetical protein [Vibrio]MDN3697096.1 hypothetical protein [Vibrio cortegadensis]NOH82264.1 hypothetical protein [Vibrio sp. 03-59-1]OEE79260.1 hypothetical protein A130_12075 [Vibrio genomosp. F6 str. FF-238]TKF21711.1 hypothetical protein FCV43_10315 [Vibrio genomosp. F6]
MKKRILPIPLILLIPILLLIIVVIGGVYRFSLSDEEILAKYPSSAVSFDPVVKAVFDLKSVNPWTIEVPETSAFSFIDELDSEQYIAYGHYDSGLERGTVRVDIGKVLPVPQVDYAAYLAPMSVSNQGSGVFYYLALFKFDTQRSRVVLADSLYVGDRISITSLTAIEEGSIELQYLDRTDDSAMADTPTVEKKQRVVISGQLKIIASE